VISTLLLQRLPDILIQFSFKAGLQLVIFRIELIGDGSLDCLNNSLFEELIPCPFAQKGLPKFLILYVEIDSRGLYLFLEVEVDVIS
jgi:hypothetical protein